MRIGHKEYNTSLTTRVNYINRREVRREGTKLQGDNTTHRPTSLTNVAFVHLNATNATTCISTSTASRTRVEASTGEASSRMDENKDGFAAVLFETRES